MSNEKPVTRAEVMMEAEIVFFVEESVEGGYEAKADRVKFPSKY